VTSAPQRPKIGIFLPLAERQMGGATARWSDLLAMTRRAEELGFDSVWLEDHLLIRLGEHPQQGVWECWSLLAALAAATERVELGTLVLCTAFRNPALTAKMADTVEEISGGRLILGLGAGYQEGEFRAFGYPFDHLYSRFAEAFTIIHGLLRHGAVDFEGAYYAARDCELRPRGPRANGPQLLIGSTGAKMLALTVPHVDQWNGWLAFGNNHPSELVPMRAKVDAACQAAGRDPATLARTVTVLVDLPSRVRQSGTKPERISGSPAEIAAQLRAFAEAGVSHIQVWPNPNTLAGIEELAEALALV
jgi:alkanesulfonate monooxygenase SsuD/methylene tetrahydromethanopterin reductase-like flavin-dependent oxidoreductase (luciferase family)